MASRGALGGLSEAALQAALREPTPGDDEPFEMPELSVQRGHLGGILKE